MSATSCKELEKLGYEIDKKKIKLIILTIRFIVEIEITKMLKQIMVQLVEER